MTGPRTFLSTLPARGATISTGAAAANGIISIHAPREGSDICWRRCRFQPWISIHAPREGSDGGHLLPGNCLILFLSTLPARGATLDAYRALLDRKISIHAPREGSDAM